MPNTAIQAVTLKQLPALQAISRATFTATFGADNTPADLSQYLTTAYSTDQLTRELTQSTTAFYFITVDQIPAGYLKLNWDQTQTEAYGPDTLEVERIYILPTFKRLGLGSALIKHACLVAKAHHKNAVWLGVWEHNQAALNFYTKLAFKPIGEHHFQLGTDLQRDIIMQKKLN